MQKALNADPSQRYQCGAEMLTDILKMKKIVAPPRFLLAKNLSRWDYFVEDSRNSKIEILIKEMAGGKNPLYIYGIGGVGEN